MAAGAGFGQSQVNAVPGWVASGTVAAPKEIGFLQRVEGLRSGLDELHERLSAFRDRLQGSGESGGAKLPVGQPVGLSSELSAAEDRLRGCLTLLGELNGAF